MDQKISEWDPVLVELDLISDLPFSHHLWVVDEIELASEIPSSTNIVADQFDFINKPSILRKWVSLYGDIFRDIFVRLALISTRGFLSYICRLGTLWFYYIMQKLFSPNLGNCQPKKMMNINTGTIYMMFCVVIIMRSGQYPVLLIKTNQNIMVAIGLYILKALPQNTSVLHTI